MGANTFAPQSVPPLPAKFAHCPKAQWNEIAFYGFPLVRLTKGAQMMDRTFYLVGSAVLTTAWVGSMVALLATAM